jgi:hypothetical protein
MENESNKAWYEYLGDWLLSGFESWAKFDLSKRQIQSGYGVDIQSLFGSRKDAVNYSGSGLSGGAGSIAITPQFNFMPLILFGGLVLLIILFMKK